MGHGFGRANKPHQMNGALARGMASPKNWHIEPTSGQELKIFAKRHFGCYPSGN